MINSDKLFKFLTKKFKYFIGVPDSVLKNITERLKNSKNICSYVPVNEGSAISIAAGIYLRKKSIPLVYMQNSGLGNAINPLASLVHKKMYSIPMVLLIGWRGSPEQSDEPQHKIKGKITKSLLKLLNINFIELKNNNFDTVSKIIDICKKQSKPVAILIQNKKLSISSKQNIITDKNLYPKRYEIIEEILKKISKNTRIFSSTGYASRELSYLRKLKNLKKGKDFYIVGSMGHTSAIYLGWLLFSKNKSDICLDGDGSMLMHLGNIFSLGTAKKNIKYILFNNNMHESVGSVNTGINKMNL